MIREISKILCQRKE